MLGRDFAGAVLELPWRIGEDRAICRNGSRAVAGLYSFGIVTPDDLTGTRMKYASALAKAMLSATYWIVVGVAYYASVAGDRYPEPREPTFFEMYGKGIVVVIVGTLIFSVLIYLLERRKPR